MQPLTARAGSLPVIQREMFQNEMPDPVAGIDEVHWATRKKHFRDTLV